MSKAGQRLLQGANEALEYAKGNANLDEYQVHYPDAIAQYSTADASVRQRNDSKTTPKVVALSAAAQNQAAASS